MSHRNPDSDGQTSHLGKRVNREKASEIRKISLLPLAVITALLAIPPPACRQRALGRRESSISNPTTHLIRKGKVFEFSVELP